MKHHLLISSLVVFATLLVWNAVADTAETDMYDDSSVVKSEEKEEHKICATNEVWMVCSSCEEECGKPPQPCPRICQPARCQCPAHKGYRRDAKGNCVFCHNPEPKQ